MGANALPSLIHKHHHSVKKLYACLLFSPQQEFFFEICALSSNLLVTKASAFQFDRFRRKAIQNIFIGGKKTPANRELDDDELLDHIKDLSQENAKLVEEINEYTEAEDRVST